MKEMTEETKLRVETLLREARQAMKEAEPLEAARVQAVKAKREEHRKRFLRYRPSGPMSFFH
jgi:hypothetical protein